MQASVSAVAARLRMVATSSPSAAAAVASGVLSCAKALPSPNRLEKLTKDVVAIAPVLSNSRRDNKLFLLE